jgi:hypothetical protein
MQLDAKLFGLGEQFFELLYWVVAHNRCRQLIDLLETYELSNPRPAVERIYRRRREVEIPIRHAGGSRHPYLMRFKLKNRRWPACAGMTKSLVA